MNNQIGFKEEQKLALLLVLWRLPECITSFISARTSGSMVMWMEFTEKMSILIPGILIGILSIRLNKNLKFRFNYGTGKVEAITALSCEMFDLCGLGCVVMFAIYRLFHPRHETGAMMLAIIISLAGLIIDVFLFIMQKRLTQKRHSRMLHTAYLSANKELVFDIIAFVSLIMGYLVKDIPGMEYFSPVLCILLAIPFSWIISKNIIDAVRELADLTLDEESQLAILKLLARYYERYDELGEVKSRRTGGMTLIDIELSFDDTSSYIDIKNTSNEIKRQIEEEFGECNVNIIVM